MSLTSQSVLSEITPPQSKSPRRGRPPKKGIGAQTQDMALPFDLNKVYLADCIEAPVVWCMVSGLVLNCFKVMCPKQL